MLFSVVKVIQTIEINLMKKYIFIFSLVISGFAFAQPSGPQITEIEFKPVLRGETELLQQPTFEALMVSAFKAGNAERIASRFSDNVDLSIDGKEDLYSDSQSEQILKTFFLTHKPKDFKVIHKGKSGQSEYFIGELSSDFVYRVTINSKMIKGVNKITSLTIEQND
ncbi:MAG: hypothetical protein BM555_05960 [Crocinitomix sp. MedPE-SWsnd]|nr:MAG: hypothetical protein BM555_05960 [Crocinitomix sp. MedPE-SWsnd]